MMLGSLLKMFSMKLPLTLDLNLCPNTKTKNASCTKCRDICPHQAVESLNPVSFRVDRCTGCGLCQGVCPTGAVKLRGFNPQSILAETTSTWVLGCKNGSADKTVPCLGCLPKDFWIALSLTTNNESISLFLGNCDDCPQKEGMARVNLLIESLPKVKERLTISTTTTNNKTVGKSISRRDFFLALREESVKTIVSALPVEEPTSQKGSREILLDIVDHKPASTLSLPQLNVTNICSGCGICTLLCPKKAIRIDGEFLVHTRAQCTGCGTCSIHCPNKCLEVSESQYAEGESPVLTGISCCSKCGSPIFDVISGICVKCAQEDDSVKLFYQGGN